MFSKIQTLTLFLDSLPDYFSQKGIFNEICVYSWNLNFIIIFFLIFDLFIIYRSFDLFDLYFVALYAFYVEFYLPFSGDS